jgi:hypothetical protein
MERLVAHVGFLGVLVALIIISILCEFTRRALKGKPKTVTWRLLTVINLIVYALCVLLLIFNILTEIVI